MSDLMKGQHQHKHNLVERNKKTWFRLFNSGHVFVKDFFGKKKKKRFATGICSAFTQDWIALTFNFWQKKIFCPFTSNRKRQTNRHTERENRMIKLEHKQTIRDKELSRELGLNRRKEKEDVKVWKL